MNKRILISIITAALAAGTALGAAGKEVVLPRDNSAQVRSDSERKALTERVDKLEALAKELVPAFVKIKEDLAFIRGRMEP